MKGVNGQQILIDAGRDLVVVKLSSQPTYTDDTMDASFWAAYEAIVREITGEAEYSMKS